MRHLSKDNVPCPTPVPTKLKKKMTHESTNNGNNDEEGGQVLLGQSLTPLGEFAGVASLPVRGNQEHDHKAPLATRLLTWVEGSTLGVVSKQLEESKDGDNAAVALMEDAGRFLGRVGYLLRLQKGSECVLTFFSIFLSLLLPRQMSLSLSTFSHSAARRPHQWDLRAVPGIRQFLPNLQSADRRSLVETVLKAFEKDTKNCDATLPWAVRNIIECMLNSAQDHGEESAGQIRL